MLRTRPNVIKHSLLILLMIVASPVFASDPFHFVGGIRVSTGSWEGENKTGDTTDFSASSRHWTLQAGYQKGPWLGSLGIGVGNFSFDDTLPDFAPAETYQDLTNGQVRLSEFDIAFGYRVWPRVYPVFGFKNFGMAYLDSFDRELSKQYSGYSVGLVGNVPLGKRWLLFGSLVGETMNIVVDDEDIGDSTGAAVELGAAYYFSPRSLLQLSLEMHSLEDDYRNGVDQTHGIGTLTLGYQRRFGR